jgi:hypothetical protein
VQLHPVVWSPVTAAAWPLQWLALVQIRPQTGKFVEPALHAAQSCDASKLLAQPLHVAPVHMLLQVQLQPVVVSPDTAVAWFEHCARVHIVVGAGVGATQPGKPMSPAAQLAHVAWLNRASQALQLAPVHCSKHVQVQPLVVSPATAVAWPAQSAALVHIVVGAGVGATQDGKLTSPAAQALQSAAES